MSVGTARLFYFLISIIIHSHGYMLNLQSDNSGVVFRCGGIHSANEVSIHPNTDPKINIMISSAGEESSNSDTLSLGWVLFSYSAQSNLGISIDDEKLNDDTKVKITAYWCESLLLERKDSPDCSREDQIGSLLFKNPPSTSLLVHGGIVPIAKGDSAKELLNFTASIKKSDYVCFLSRPTLKSGFKNYKVQLHYSAPYGELPGEYYGLLVMNIAICVLYGCLGASWAYFLQKYKKEVVAIQKYILLAFIFLTLESFFNILYLRYFSQDSTALLTIVLLFSAAKSSLSLFLLLLISKGYGIVYRSIGDDSKKIYALTAFQFFATVLNSGLFLDRPSVGNFLLVSFIGYVTTGVFFFWISSSLFDTKMELEKRNQTIKLQMFNSLSTLLMGCMIALIVILFVSTFILLGHAADNDWWNVNWQYIWLYNQGWIAIFYVIGFLGLCWLWRPRRNNPGWALQQVAPNEQDDADIEDLSDSNTFGGRKPSDQGIPLNVLEKSVNVTELDENSKVNPFGHYEHATLFTVGSSSNEYFDNAEEEHFEDQKNLPPKQ